MIAVRSSPRLRESSTTRLTSAGYSAKKARPPRFRSTAPAC